MISPRPGTHLLDELTPEAAALLTLIPNASYLVGVEVGTLRGRTATLLLAHRPGLRLIALDNWDCGDIIAYEPPEDVEAAAASNFWPWGARAELVDGESPTVADEVPLESCDFVYLDAKHDRASVGRDLVAWWPRVRAGGMLCGHDYDRPKPEAVPGLPWDVKGAVDAFAKDEALPVLLPGGTVWAALKQPGG